ncbi:NAD(P)/FAD-dependent oxidoreductase [Dyadobacter flavalbus]|uniref:NAD(P)/FAD-dependent oxidoreductase n=1 Tax=Dyadobacter flavalbus TaxID=2579942 RepID=A0A5M8R1T4_9BACT|nr:NAD(P)/FAD-dependent oxidoreductase [Dyadobacter flavalbus]KAA6441270.1 NAD(P)/FAD-dependent oxidoreductase [Dyadobacter flavalbus]
METEAKKYDCAIIGGGLAGLCLAIQLAVRNISVILFEKNQYPFHKVCGEYISMESHDFLAELGLPFEKLELPYISKLGISSEKGFMLEHELGMGGFGISRHSLDQYLFRIASEKGVTILQNCRVNDVQQHDPENFIIATSKGIFSAEIVCGSYGKYTPAFINPHVKSEKNDGTANYIGVKYHIKTNLAPDRIELHNFRNGYCGISKVDRDWHCLCYLTTSENLLKNGKDIKKMEENVLFRNPFLKAYFVNSQFVSSQPLVISNVNFSKKQTQAEGIFLLGDAAGCITPLCGNGMSMGMRASKLLATELIRFYRKEQSLQDAAVQYQSEWNKAFQNRITAGYYLQNLFGKRNLTDIALKLLSKSPALTDKLVSLTHGNRF